MVNVITLDCRPNVTSMAQGQKGCNIPLLRNVPRKHKIADVTEIIMFLCLLLSILWYFKPKAKIKQLIIKRHIMSKTK